ncbi:hypothetical protein KU306_14440 [Haloferax larsenii]|uniref:Uncharacterized protein n=1 Tax=Haloferax larsenii TaxID=302484 RepID=A0ABY5REQ8_HALLR|nr:hypothetical protein [Haloferax larsenii]UVE50087.1 hypothetical protein KU306_14440 [Haloferax larsenii]
MEIVNQPLVEGNTIEFGKYKTKKLTTDFQTARIHAVCESGSLETYVVLRKVVNHADNDVSFPSNSVVFGIEQNPSKANVSFVWYGVPKSAYGTGGE